MKELEYKVNKINELIEKYPQLVHANNILGKYNNRTKYKNEQQKALCEIILKYYCYLDKNLKIKGYSDENIKQRVQLLNEYYNFFNEKDYDNIFTSQGKFRPTILEEFMFLLFRDYVAFLKEEYGDEDNVIKSGSAGAYTNLYFTSTNFKDFIKTPKIEINKKNQDFAIYRDYDLKVNNKNHNIKIPIVAIENKTYIDKTMLEGSIATAEKIKNGNPYSKFLIVAENYEVDLSVDPAYSRIDQIYVLRKSKRKDGWMNIDENVVVKFFKEVQEHIERPWSNVERKMREEGIII